MEHSLLYQLREVNEMKEVIRILVVEDDLDSIELYEDSAKEVSDNHHDIEIELIKQNNAQEALDSLKDGDFDGAIVDLNLEPGNPTEAAGNEIVASIYQRNRFPIKVVSGNLDNLSEQFKGKENSFLKFHTRDELSNDEIFESFVSLFKTGITKILGQRGELEKQLSTVFWEHLASDIEEWGREGGTEQALLRYTLNHLNEYIDRSLSVYDEREFYIKPPIRSYISTGDVVVNDKQERYLVMSPACDVTPRRVENDAPIINASRIVLCPLLSISKSGLIGKNIIQENTGSSKIKSALEKIVKGQDPKFHFLPKHGVIDASMCDFQNIHTCTVKEYLNFNRVATVSGGFMRDIQSRFTAYIGRQGQPDLDKDGIARGLVENLI